MADTGPADPKKPAAKAALRSSALVLCAHGVGDAGGMPVALAAAIRSKEMFAQVEACRLTGAQGLVETMRNLGDRPVYLVPLLMAEGHTYHTVLPRLLSQAGDRPASIHCCRAIGMHPGLAPIAAAMAAEACGARDWPPGETAVVIAAHGTKRHPESGKSAEGLAEAVAVTGQFRDVRAGYLEQPPSLDETLHALRPGFCVVVGFFMAEGPHSTVDVPQAIERAHSEAAYTGPIGMRPEIAGLAADLVRREASEGN